MAAVGAACDSADVLRPYRDVLAVPGAPAFVVAGALARLPISMVGLTIIFLYEARTGSYGYAGLLAATSTLVTAAVAPLLARLVDRHGQARVMRPAVAVQVAALVGLVLAADAAVPRGVPYLAAALSGAAAASIGGLVRARWVHALRGRPELDTAYALESVLDEVVFIVGPTLATLLATGVDPALGPLAAAAAVGVGGTALLAQRATEPPPQRATGEPAGRLWSPGIVVLLGAFVFVGGVFGAVEVAVVAFTEERGAPAAAALVLAVFAAGSMVSGIGYGTVRWRWPTGRRFRLAVVLLAAGTAPVALVQSIWALSVVVFVAGFAISPMLIAGNGLVTELVAPGRLTEGLSWVSTTLGAGIAVGAAATGPVIDADGAHVAMRVPVAAGLLAAVVGLAGSRWLGSRSSQTASRPS